MSAKLLLPVLLYALTAVFALAIVAGLLALLDPVLDALDATAGVAG